MPELAVLGAAHLEEAVAFLLGQAEPPVPQDLAPPEAEAPAPLDLADVRGHNGLIGALEVAAAGGHNLYLYGPPGTGKTMLARRLPSILPPLTPAEAIEVTRIQSVGGLHHGGGLATARPFRAPHHTVSASGPGRRRLAAHAGRGDARPPRRAVPRRAVGVRRGRRLEALRQPLEDGHVTIVRGAEGDGVPDALHARGGVEPVPVRDGRRRLHAAAPPTSRATTGACRGRCWTGSTSCWPSAARPPARCATSRRRSRPPCASASSPRASARPPGWRPTG